jgi:hypothetical protein
MRAAVEGGMRLVAVEFAREVIGILSRENVLNCPLEKALEMFDFDNVSTVSSRSKASKKRENSKPKSDKQAAKITAKPSVILPFCGEIQGDWCHGVKFNHGLHTQCTNAPSGKDTYCKTCRKHADNSATGQPPYGDINERAKFDVDYRDPKGKLTVPYANVIEKLAISMDAAENAATVLGWTIPECQKMKRDSKRGRPSKSAAVSDTESESSTTSKPKAKKKGRPAKAKKSKVVTQEDQIALLVAEASSEEQQEDAKVSAIPNNIKKVSAAKKKAEKQALKEQEKLAKKEAADKLKADKQALKDAEKLAKKEAADKLKAEKQALKEAEKLVKKEAADKLKADKQALKDAEKLAKKEAAVQLKEQKKLAKKEAALKLKTEKKDLKEAEKLATKVAIESPQLEEEVIEDVEMVIEDLEIPQVVEDQEEDIVEDQEEDIQLSEKMTVQGVEYYHHTDEEGHIILFTMNMEPVGIYDADTDTVQEADFDDSDCDE